MIFDDKDFLEDMLSTRTWNWHRSKKAPVPQ